MTGSAVGGRRIVLAALGCLVLASSALAHHGFGGRYDRSRPIALVGTVETAYFGYPHAEIVLRVDRDMPSEAPAGVPSEFANGVREWSEELGPTPEIEFPPVRRFFALDGQVAGGDRVAVVVLRNCEPPHQLRGQWIRLASGETVTRAGRMQSEADGC